MRAVSNSRIYGSYIIQFGCRCTRKAQWSPVIMTAEPADAARVQVVLSDSHVRA